MTFLADLLTNRMLIVPIIAWALAQIIKTALYAFLNKDFVAERLVGGGGMPSAHSATVCSLAATAAFLFGLGSFEFAICTVFAIVTMYDAMGVRRETGRQGEVLNDVIEIFNKMGKHVGPEKALKELIGHSPFQVLMGGLLGIAISFASYYLF